MLKVELFFKNKIKGLKYNFLSGVETVLSFLLFILIFKNFGKSAKTDSYFMTLTIVNTLQLFSSSLTEQFLYFYSKIKIENVSEANAFHQTCFWVNNIFSFLIFILVFFFNEVAVKIFAKNIDHERLIYIVNFLRIMTSFIFLQAFVEFNNKLLNAEQKFSLPYILNMIPTCFAIVALFLHITELKFIIYAQLTGLIFSLIARIYYLKKLKFKIAFSLRHKQLKEIIKKSIPMRMVLSIHNVCLPVVTTNILSMLPLGNATLFYYVQTIISTLSKIIIWPVIQIYDVKISRYIHQKKKQVYGLIKATIKKNLILFSFSIIATIIILPSIMDIFFHNSITSLEQKTIIFLIVAFIPNVIFAIIEQPITNIFIACHKSILLMYILLLQVCIYSVANFCLFSYVGIYSIPISFSFMGMVSTLFSLFLFKKLKFKYS